MFGLRGDSMGAQGVWAHGAAGYATSNWGAMALFQGGNNVALGWIVDGIYGPGTSVALTNVWSVNGYYEHIWNPKWRTSVYFGAEGEDFGSTGKALICPERNRRPPIRSASPFRTRPTAVPSRAA